MLTGTSNTTLVSSSIETWHETYRPRLDTEEVELAWYVLMVNVHVHAARNNATLQLSYKSAEKNTTHTHITLFAS